MLPTVRSAGMSTEGDGWLLGTTTPNSVLNQPFEKDYKKLRTTIKSTWKTKQGQNKSLTAIAPQVDDKHRLQSQLEFYHWSHQRDKKVPSTHP
jgi:hypothetical protein